MLLAMQFKDFTWPNNPKTYTLHAERLAPAHKIPMGDFCVQELGKSAIELRGEGEFFGDRAYEDFRRLLAVFGEDGAGRLVHPIWQCDAAYFTELKLTQQPRRDYVAYRFCFRQSGLELTAQTKTGSRSFYPAQEGDTLWSVCRKCGLTMTELLRLNPALREPGASLRGKELRIV